MKNETHSKYINELINCIHVLLPITRQNTGGGPFLILDKHTLMIKHGYVLFSCSSGLCGTFLSPFLSLNVFYLLFGMGICFCSLSINVSGIPFWFIALFILPFSSLPLENFTPPGHVLKFAYSHEILIS